MTWRGQICPSCQIPFSPTTPLATPLILPCLHTVCRACVEYKCSECPVHACNVSLPKEAANLYPVNYHVLGRAAVDGIDSGEQEFTVEADSKITSKSFYINREQNSLSSSMTVTKAEELLLKLAKAKDNLEEIIKKERDNVEAAVDKIVSHVDMCHAQLEWVGSRMRGEILENLKISDNSMKNNLLDMVERLAVQETKNELNIDEGIFGMLERHIVIKSPCTPLKKEESIVVGDESLGRIIDIGVDSEEGEDTVGDGDDDAIPVFNSTREVTKSSVQVASSDASIYDHMDAVEITTEKVEVSWVNSPSDFYVTRLDDLPLLERIDGRMELLEKVDVDHDDYNVGEIVAVEVENQTMLRAEVLEVVEGKIRLRYIDEGGEGVHIVDDLHTLPEDLAKIPGLARQCSLAGIEPPTSGWSKLAAGSLAEVTDGTVCLLTLPDKSNPSIVNLYLEPDEVVSKDQECCLSSYLVFKGLARWRDGESRATQTQTNQNEAGTFSTKDSRVELKITGKPLNMKAEVSSITVIDVGVESEDENICVNENSDGVPVFNSSNDKSEQDLQALPSGASVFEKMEAVEITYVNSPSDLYVMRLDDIPLLERIEYEMELEVDIDCTDDDYNVGDIVAVEVEDQALLRAKVLKVEEEKFTLKYIDEGGEGVHISDDLHALPEELSNIPGLAQQCSLAGIEPPASGWSMLATGLLAQVTDGTICLVTLPDKENSSMVNLYVEPGEGVSKDQKCCLSSYLVYKGLARYKEGEPRAKTNVYQKGFLKLAPPREGSESLVMVSHIEDPSQLFVQRTGDEGGYTHAIRMMVEELMTIYSCRKNDQSMHVLVPMVDIACVALMSNKQYLRAQVTKLIGDGMVEVQFVDYGNKEIIEDSKVFKILDKFLMLPVMAIPVCLAGIGTLDGRNEWDQEASKVLSKITWMKELLMLVNEEQSKDSPCKVLLYEMLDNRDVCVNACMVKEGQAVSLSGVCNTVDYLRDVAPVGSQEIAHDVTVKSAAGMTGVKKVEKVACRVVSVGSPASIHIRQVMDDANYQQLITELQDHYSGDEGIADVLPEVGALFAVHVDDSIGWARAKVIAVEGGLVKVKLLDIGRDMEMKADRLKQLDIKFRFKNFVDEVHLVDVLPNGGVDTWPRAACNALDNILEKYDYMVFVEMIKMPGKGKGSLPVKMFLQDGDEFVCVSDNLVQLGLAQPTEEEMKVTAVKEEMEVNSLELISSYVESEPVEWLKPVPPPMDEFLAIPSHVDWEGNIFICPLVPNQENLNIVCNVLNSKYQGSVHKPVDKYWKVGQACVARWDLDGKWYRGQVLVVGYQEFTVEFVDYGTVEIVTVEDMRKDLFMTEMPIQCFPVQLDNIQPVTEKWERTVLDFLHSIVVDQTLSVVITRTVRDENNDRDKLMGKLIKAGSDIATLLVEKGYARTESEII